MFARTYTPCSSILQMEDPLKWIAENIISTYIEILEGQDISFWKNDLVLLVPTRKNYSPT